MQAATCALIGTGLGLGLCSLAGVLVGRMGFPVCLAAPALSLRPVLKLQPAVVFAGGR